MYAVCQHRRNQSDCSRRLRIHAGTEAACDVQRVDVRQLYAAFLGERQNARTDRCLGELKLPHVLGGNPHPVRQHKILPQKAGILQLLQLQHHGKGIQHAGAADAGRLAAADNLERHVVLCVTGDRADGTVRGRHTAGQTRTLERRTGCRGAADQLAVVQQRHLAVGADVREQGGVRLVCHAGGENCTGDVRTDVCTRTARQIDRRTGERARADASEIRLHLERGNRQRSGIQSLEQVQHCAVAGDNRLGDF